MNPSSILPADLEAAAARIAPHVRRTPLWRSRTLDARCGRQVWLKCENLQGGGSFKLRGATNAILKLEDAVAQHGVVAHSSGNHGQAVALAAARRGIRADIVIPEGAPEVKRAAAESYGATIHRCAPTMEARISTAQALVERRGATLIHPFEHPDVIAGQSTIALEILEALPDVDSIVVPVGGGGMAAGTLLRVEAMGAAAAVHGVEPSGADDAAQSLRAGRRIDLPAPQTIADGLRAGLGALAWEILRERITDIHTVNDAEILESMKFLMERCKLVVEPSGATALAAVMNHKVPGSRIAVVLSGGNVELGPLFRSFV